MSIGIIIALLMIIGGTTAFFDKILREEDVKKVKDAIINMWVKVEEFNYSQALRKSHSYFIQLFDNVYGTRGLSWKCFLRSFISTTLVLALTIPFYVPGDLSAMHTDIIQVIIALCFMNLIIDYVSLLQSRYILRASVSAKLPLLTILLMIDLILTYLIFLIPSAGILSIYLTGHDYMTVKEVSQVYWVMLSSLWNPFERLDSTFGPFLISTFFTSAFFYLFLVTTSFIKLFNVIKLPTAKFIYWLGSLKNPLTTIAGAIAALILVIKGIMMLFERI